MKIFLFKKINIFLRQFSNYLSCIYAEERMNKTIVLSGIFVFAVLFSFGFSPLENIFAGKPTDPDMTSSSCGGKATKVGTSGNDENAEFGTYPDNPIWNSSQVYNMKDGDDFVFDIDRDEPHTDIVRMGDGNDIVYMYNGHDIICLGDGDDRAFVRDGYADFVKCGDGFDIVTLDDYDITDGQCEVENYDQDPRG